MPMTVVDSQGIAEESLPVSELVAQLRLADQYESVPGQEARLKLRLRSAIGAVERRLGKVLIRREFILAGEVKGGTRIVLPIAPVDSVISVSASRAGALFSLGEAMIEPDGHQPVAVMKHAINEGEWVRMTVHAGFGDWPDVPDALRQAVLLMAEALDAGDGPGLVPMAEALVAPFRNIRVGSIG
ncbi:hypothetical protein [uncultured Jannaschia sp.]|uniref:head-tail connector protein n=1 Tax=uncultured Jannaschia sp. TaxID=293347 RepID=UPI002607A5E9|nr:hypothetical protein [uncultured Jannaschia sp.]